LHPFSLNTKSLTYFRLHSESARYTLVEQLKKDRLLLSDIIHSDFSLPDFFPDLDNKNDDEVSKAWIWMGHLYYNLGAYRYANACYSSAVSTQRNYLRRLLTFYRLQTLKIKRMLKTDIPQFLRGLIRVAAEF